MKSGMFIDEIYTYGLANSYYKPFVQMLHQTDENKVNTMIDSVLTQKELSDYVEVNADDAFALDSVYYNQEQDVHPPLYDWMFHLISSFFPGVFSKWLGLVMNIVVYMIKIFILYLLTMEITKSDKYSIGCILLYGLSTAGITTVTMIRMYILLTLFKVSLAYFIIQLMRKDKWYCNILFDMASNI